MTVLEIPTPDPRAFDETSRPFAEAVASRYAIKRLIGRGGMGIVYLARDRRVDRLVAIKTLPPHLAADESVKQRFLREIRTAGAMSHPHIVPIHGADEIDGHVFFVMGFVEGESLAATIRAMGRLEPMTVARILRDVALALAHAHGRGTIHRDVKAENILIERSSGRAMVTDFGIARLAEAGPLTATGQLLGTVYYVSPEQVSGDRIDHRSDLYSLGVVGFLALTGTFPFDAELASAVLVAHVNKAPPALRAMAPAVPAELAAIIDRCLAKDPGRRFATAGEMVEALERVLSGQRPPSSRPRLISDTEAHAVWERAASLQASTGVETRPAPAAIARDAAADAARTSGHVVEDVRDAGREAGINTRYLDRALVEHGLGGSPTLPRQQRSSWWAGVPLEIVREAEVPGEIEPRQFDRLFNLLRDGTGLAGVITARHREMGWRAEWFGHSLDVSIMPDEGRTLVRLRQRLGGMAAAVMATTIGIAGGVLGPMASVVSARLMDRRTPGWVRDLGIDLWISRSNLETIAIGIGAAVALASIPLARALVRRLRRHHESRLHLLGEAVGASVELSARDGERR